MQVKLSGLLALWSSCPAKRTEPTSFCGTRRCALSAGPVFDGNLSLSSLLMVMLLRGSRGKTHGATAALLFAAVAAVICLSAKYAQSVSPTEACVDFAENDLSGESSWSLAVCVDVWTAWVDSISHAFNRPDSINRKAWRQAAEELRRLGTPCLVEPQHSSDGVGSSWIRHVATWILAEEMGCDWVTPRWSKRPIGEDNSNNGTQLYCHATGTVEEMVPTKPAEELWPLRRCTVANWLAYFHFDVPSVPRPISGTFKVVQVRGHRGLRQVAKKASAYMVA